MKKEKAEKMVELIRHNMSDGSTVCDSVMRCKGWEENATIPQTEKYKRDGAIQRVTLNLLMDTYKFCPWCGKEIKWAVE